jgi:uncharacterized protein (TIGR00269 family)
MAAFERLVPCSKCSAPAITLIRYSGQHLCRAHFLDFVERRAKAELRRQVDFRGGETVAVGLSGGKDSSAATLLLHEVLGGRRGMHLVAVTVDEGIAAYRPGGLEAARHLCASLGVEHVVVGYRERFGATMDEVVERDPEAIPCGYCGVFRRGSLNAAARELGADYLVTGLNLDDTAQGILMNLCRGDIPKLARLGPHTARKEGLVPRLQPLRTIPEKEVYLYAMLRGLRFHDATCPHAERAQRLRFRDMVMRLEGASPGTRHALLASYEELRPLLAERYAAEDPGRCERCGEPATLRICRACELTERLAGMA